MNTQYILWLTIAFSVMSSFIGISFVVYAYNNRYRNSLAHVVRIRDELIKLSLVAKFPESQRAELTAVIEQAFSIADSEMGTTMELLIGAKGAGAIMTVLHQSDGSNLGKELLHG